MPLSTPHRRPAAAAPRVRGVPVIVAAVAAAGLLAAALPSRAAEGPEQFFIPHEATGRLMPQRHLESAVPINRRYEEMAPQYQAVLRGLYENLAADDEPPFPRDGLKRVFSEFERVEERALVAGEVLLTVTVGADGKPQAVKVYKTPHSDVATAAAFLLMKEDYKPGKCHGVPCTMDYLFDVTLKVDHDVTRSKDGVRNN